MALIFRRMYEELKAHFLGSGADIVPEQFRSNFVNVGGAYEANYIVRRLLSEGGKRKGKVLIVGVYGGRDYYGLLFHGYEVCGFDLSDIAGFPNLKTGNVEGGVPFPDEEFDAVVVGEVIEHLKYDARALENIKRVLKKDGALVVTVPFLHDRPEYHVRVHTRKSVTRLLRACGFKVVVVVERPALIRAPRWVNWLHHLFGWASMKAFGFLPHRVVLPLWGRIEYRMGQMANPLRKWSSAYGGYFLCTKADEEFDHIAANIEEFEKHKDEKD